MLAKQRNEDTLLERIRLKQESAMQLMQAK